MMFLRESHLSVRIAGDLAPDVAHHAAEIRAQCLPEDTKQKLTHVHMKVEVVGALPTNGS
ncbi:MAG: hypothetical protein ABI150_08510 [Nitrobacter sp.]